MSGRFNANNVIGVFNSYKDDHITRAKENDILMEELDNVFIHAKSIMKNRTIPECAKYVLWHSIINNFGIFSKNKFSKRKFSNDTCYHKNYEFGDLLSIDFGTHGIATEFSYTHSGIVISNYSDLITVIPFTSKKDVDPSWLTNDETKTHVLVTKEDCTLIAEDSYALIFHIITVAKNRITKYIGNIAHEEIMSEISEKIKSNFLLTSSKIHDRMESQE